MERNGGSGASGGGRLAAGIFGGVLIGVLMSLCVIWYFNRTPMPFQDKGQHPGTTASTTPDGLPAPLPAKPGDKPQDKPRFDFYKILPQGESGTPVPPGAANPADQPAAIADVFYLQLGAFQKPTDADNLKARLALMGVDVSVQDIDGGDKGMLHRVRAGPYERPEDMNRVRNQLSQSGIQATVVKVKESSSAGSKSSQQ